MLIKFWKSLTYTTKFSTVAFFVTAALGLLSMGALGGGLYYLVSFLFNDYPDINDWRGDWVWPTMISVGMLWSLGFVFGGITWYFLSKKIKSIVILRISYLLVLWLWIAFLWDVFITANIS